MPTDQAWALLPIINLSDSPEAGLRAESITAALVRTRGMATLDEYPTTGGTDRLPELDERKRFESARNWAAGQGYKVALTGSVEEWRYKVGLDGEPAVGLSLRLIEPASGAVLWTASGARSGWGRGSVSGTAHKLIDELLSGIQTQP
ncbi:MAG: penicillin-binding protein activator LpoB [Gammaproteobacteria bacterium]